MNLFFKVDFSTKSRVLYTKQLMLYVISFKKDDMLSWVDSSIVRLLRMLTFNNEFNEFEF